MNAEVPMRKSMRNREGYSPDQSSGCKENYIIIQGLMLSRRN